MKTYYGRAAYEGFARALAMRLGVQVQVTDGANACVDANGVIQIPGLTNYQTHEEFEDTCAVIVHEVSHVFYGSHEEFASHSRKSRLWRDCLNAVMDVADETGIGDYEKGRGNGRPETLLVNSNIHAWNNHKDTYTDKKHPLPHWQLLATGIIRARIPTKGTTGRNAMLSFQRKRFAGKVDVAAAFRILQSARTIGQEPFRPWKVTRRMRTLATRLDAILKPLEPADNAQENPDFAPFVMAAGSGTLPAGATEASESDGESFGFVPAPIPAPKQSTPPAPKAGTGRNACAQTRALLEPVIRRIADRMATDGESINRDSGYYSGTGVQQAYRLMTDGQCMGRWNTDPHADGLKIAVLLDVSDSMSDMLLECAGVAQAFVQGMRDCAEVKTWKFSNDVYPCEDFAQVETVDMTNTGLALQTAIDWLKNESGRRMIVLITDGCPTWGVYDPESECQSECQRAQSHGINVSGICIMDTAAPLLHSLPGASLAVAPDAYRLAIELESIGRNLESLAA